MCACESVRVYFSMGGHVCVGCCIHVTRCVHAHICECVCVCVCICALGSACMCAGGVLGVCDSVGGQCMCGCVCVCLRGICVLRVC